MVTISNNVTVKLKLLHYITLYQLLEIIWEWYFQYEASYCIAEHTETILKVASSDSDIVWEQLPIELKSRSSISIVKRK